MKKRLALIAALLVFLGAGIWLFTTGRSGMDIRTSIVLASVYAALALAAPAALERDWRSIPPLALYGVMIGALGITFAVVVAAFIAVLILVVALFAGEREAEGKREEKDTENVLQEGSGILLKSGDAVYFQLFRGRDKIYLVSLGCFYYKFNPERAIRAESDAPRGEGDLVFGPNDLRAVNLYPDGTLRFLTARSVPKRARQDARFEVLPPKSAEDVAAYLAGFPVDVRRVTGYRPSERAVRGVRNVTCAICTAGGLGAALWMHTAAPGRPLVGLTIAASLAAYALYCVFGDVKPSGKNGISWNLAMSVWDFTLLPLMYHAKADFNFDSLAQFILPFAILGGGALLLFFAFNARRRTKNFVNTLALILMFCAYAVGPLNYALDDGSRLFQRTGTVVDKYIHDEDEPAVFMGYFLYVEADGDYSFLRIPRDIYDTVETDGLVSVVTHYGPLGIDYTEVLPYDQGDGK
jgi:uncharacterized membrane protein